MNRLQQLICAAVLGWAFAPSQAQADPPGSGRGDAKAEKKQDKAVKKDARANLKDARKDARADLKEDRADLKDARKEAHDERKDARRDARDERKDARDEHRDAQKARHGDDDGHDRKLGHRKHEGKNWEPSPEFLETMKKRHESRKERRDERRKKYEAKWGEFARGKPAINEFRLHGWRMAKLRRIRLVAEAMGKDKLVGKVDDLIEKEKARHDKALERVKASGGKDAEASAGNAQGPKPAKLEKPAPKPKPALPVPAKAAKEGE
jgi:hypothetical protein